MSAAGSSLYWAYSSRILTATRRRALGGGVRCALLSGEGGDAPVVVVAEAGVGVGSKDIAGALCGAREEGAEGGQSGGHVVRKRRACLAVLTWPLVVHCLRERERAYIVWLR
jgi:hypothetical protein